MSTMTIDPNQSVITLINVFKVEPTRQKELSALLQEITDNVMCRQPGFVGASLHLSLDGRCVVNYVQWASREVFESAIQKPEARAHIEIVEKLALSIEPVLHRVEAVQLARNPAA